MTDHDPAEPDCPLNQEGPCGSVGHLTDRNPMLCDDCGEACQCALIAKFEQRGREMERAERLACICDTNPTTTDGPSEDCPQHGRPYVEAYDGGYRAGRADALAERGVIGEPLDVILDDWIRLHPDVHTQHNPPSWDKPRYSADRPALIGLLRRARSAAPAPLTLAQLEALPAWSIVMDGSGLPSRLLPNGEWDSGHRQLRAGALIEFGPVYLLHAATTTPEG